MKGRDNQTGGLGLLSLRIAHHRGVRRGRRSGRKIGIGIVAVVLVAAQAILIAGVQGSERRDDGVVQVADLDQTIWHHVSTWPYQDCGQSFVAREKYVPLRIVWIGEHANVSIVDRGWDSFLHERFPGLEFRNWGMMRVYDEYEAAKWLAPDGVQNMSAWWEGIILVLSNHRYVDDAKGTGMAGVGCGNLAIVDRHAACLDAVVAHEIGHVLGLPHEVGGMMNVSCSLELTATARDSLRRVHPAWNETGATT